MSKLTDAEKIEKIRDIVEGTIDDLDREEALDVIYEVKDVVEKKWWRTGDE